jgi:hypothetical protein
MITIYKDRIVYKNSRNKKIKINENNLLQFVDAPVEIAKGVTFGRIMSILNASSGHVNFFFNRTLGGYHIQDFYEDMMKKTNDHYDPKNEYLEVYQYPDIWKYEKSEERLTINIVNGFHLQNIKEKQPYGLSFVKLCNIKNLEIRIDLNMDFVIYDSTKKITKSSLKPKFKAVQESMTLYNFLQSILYEISWHGSPADRDKRGKSLEDIVYEFTESKNVEQSNPKK